MYIKAALGIGERALVKSSTSPRLDAEVLLAHVLHMERGQLLARLTEKLLPWPYLCFRWLLARRQNGIPLAYLTHTKEFYGHNFYVDKRVLIPRPDTELLVEESLRTIRAPVHRSFSEGGNGSLDAIIDIGTGSGCIAVTLALELPHIKGIATDISKGALKVAKKNALAHGVANRITFLHGDLLEPTLPYLAPSALLIANLPYVLPEEITGDLTNEPRAALVGGTDGLTFYQKILQQLSTLPPTALPKVVLLELHPPTAPQVQALASEQLPDYHSALIQDLHGLPRVLRLE